MHKSRPLNQRQPRQVTGRRGCKMPCVNLPGCEAEKHHCFPGVKGNPNCVKNRCRRRKMLPVYNRGSIDKRRLVHVIYYVALEGRRRLGGERRRRWPWWWPWPWWRPRRWPRRAGRTFMSSAMCRSVWFLCIKGRLGFVFFVCMCVSFAGLACRITSPPFDNPAWKVR